MSDIDFDLTEASGLGEGVRLFDHLGNSPIHLEHLRTLDTPGATHLSFRVVK